MREPGRVMALDVGGRRIGVALSDPTRLLASPLMTLRAQPSQTVFTRIADLLKQHEVAELVIGMPFTLRGEEGPQAKIVQAFVQELRRYVSVPIHFFDERLTTVEAERVMIELGIKREQRQARIDEFAASIILRDFLGAHEPPHRFSDDWLELE